MLNSQSITEAFTAFLIQPDKGWTLCGFPFLMAFIVFFAIYIAIQKSRKAVVLTYVIIFSLFFAWKANGILMLLLPATALFSWYATRLMMRSSYHRRLWLTIIILVDLAPLLYFKYTNFLSEVINDIIGSNFGPLEIFLPIGMSFYTFQAISYTVDVYKWRFTSETPLLDYFFYLTFFPLLMAGPITRAEVLIPQISNINNFQPKHRLRNARLANKGLWLIIIGLIKKAVVADYIAQFNNMVFADPTAYSGFENLMAVIGFTLQIFFDFSGYSDMAIGLAALMGFELRDNFNFPYQSLNPTEFWHRWHISLSTWFRDYVYIPLGGNRRGFFITCINLMITMLAAGLWHGASWMFILWGAIHGIALVAHKAGMRLFLDRIPDNIPVKIVCWTMMFAFICFTWVFFRSPDLDTAWSVISRIGSNFSISYLLPFLKARPVWLLLVVLGLELQSIRRDDYEWMQEKFIALPWPVKLLTFAIVTQLVINFSQSSVQPFIYTNF